VESNLDPDEESNLDPDGAESVAELVYSELGLSQELVDLRVREDMGEEVYVLEYDPDPVPSEDILLLES